MSLVTRFSGGNQYCYQVVIGRSIRSPGLTSVANPLSIASFQALRYLMMVGLDMMPVRAKSEIGKEFDRSFLPGPGLAS